MWFLADEGEEYGLGENMETYGQLPRSVRDRREQRTQETGINDDKNKVIIFLEAGFFLSAEFRYYFSSQGLCISQMEII